VANVSVLNERLDSLRALIQSEGFLTGDGLSNEVNIRVFCYDPADEMTVQHFIGQLITDQSLNCHLLERNLYRTFLSICEDMGVEDEIPAMEEEEGSEYLLEQLRTFATPTAFVEKLQYSPHEKGDVLLLTGVGDVFPFMRVHALLEALQPKFSDIPILVMYPGTFDKSALRLFYRLTPNAYYRAFTAI